MTKIPAAAIDHLAVTRSLLRAVEMMVPGLTDDIGEQGALLALLQVIDARLLAVSEGSVEA